MEAVYRPEPRRSPTAGRNTRPPATRVCCSSGSLEEGWRGGDGEGKRERDDALFTAKGSVFKLNPNASVRDAVGFKRTSLVRSSVFSTLAQHLLAPTGTLSGNEQQCDNTESRKPSSGNSTFIALLHLAMGRPVISSS